MICLSLRPARETLQSLLLLRPALCPLFSPAQRPGTRGEQIDLLRGPYWQFFCCLGQCQALALHAWLGVRCWPDNKRSWSIWSDAVIVDKPCLVFAFIIYHPNIRLHCHRCVSSWGNPVFLFYNLCLHDCKVVDLLQFWITTCNTLINLIFQVVKATGYLCRQ